MESAGGAVADAQHHVDAFERIYQLLNDKDGPRAIEAAEVYIALWNERLKAAQRGEWPVVHGHSGPL